ncbi:Hsk1-interacting molecule 1 [Psilocybe cubensis]|uniref:Hsk1-interacting molecule 1 n=2 Tax=Psilocybe cubensis TaxID=181762 RepID=A0ACB8HBJ6_PSICU|nr:Hsk1-interacting molecule 1 [Psilocybe cubensis]KAH9485303.1 Hsk1-interacting molecule 1 [Psilocybe cubensis]
MATSLPARRPLANRSVQGTSNPSPIKQTRSVSGSKRPHSPDRGDSNANPIAKRVRGTATNEPTASHESRATEKTKREKEKAAQRMEMDLEFKDKYSRAFPGFRFYFDAENITTSTANLKAMISRAGGITDPFFSSSITHVIADKQNTISDKENVKAKSIQSTLKSPIKLLGRGSEACSVVEKAREYGLKVWSTAKLESVLDRTLNSPVPYKQIPSLRQAPIPQQPPQQRLQRLLAKEKTDGNLDRDPSQKRHDYHYFARGSCFVLLEDIRGELATIAAHEYPPYKERDKNAKKPWPVLHCHPLARNPFIPFDEKERRRWERLQKAELDQEEERLARKKRELETMKRKAEAYTHGKGTKDLRRSVSVSNLVRRHSVGGGLNGTGAIDLDADYDDLKSANASGYIAASGNSVGITSTTGTTSTSGRLGRNVPLSNSLTQSLQQHVVTSRKPPSKVKADDIETPGVMGPPIQLPIRQPILKKSKSTNTLKLPKREEGVKPGYCESCRMKFDDFSTHVESKRHRKFAENDDNFFALDQVIQRVQRQKLDEIEEEKYDRDSAFFYDCKLKNRKHHIYASPDRVSAFQ